MVHPQSASVKFGVLFGVVGGRVFPDGLRAEGAGSQSVGDAFAGEWLNHARRVAHKPESFLHWWQGRATEGGDATPALLGREFEAAPGPIFEGVQIPGAGHQTEVRLVFAHGREAGVTLVNKLKRDIVLQINGRFKVRLDGYTLIGQRRGKEAELPGNGRVTAVGSYELRRVKHAPLALDAPPVWEASQFPKRGALVNICSALAGAREK
jgi:hypothetical protein